MRNLALILLAAAWLGCGGEAPPPEAPRPNIVLVMTDDQGWAQLGMRGDDALRTPHLDKLAAESVELTRFYVSPVCAPTRASLMTGRYNYRTGVVDTYMGRAMMAPEETTIAELLGEAGYRTGIFGKWHLGDNYPMRAIDQGFQRAIVHRGGGIGQPSDPEGSDYLTPSCSTTAGRNSTKATAPTYFNEAMRFIDEGGDQPFFVYLPTNAPHSPYLVPASYREPYAAQGLDDKDARIYGMITNIDDNVGRLLSHLDAKGLRESTIFIFMTDNGPTTQRFTAGLRDQKASVYEGGIRAPFFLRWPGVLEPKKVETIAAHIDVAPTLLEAARVSKPSVLNLDGRSLMPLLRLGDAAEWHPRRLFIQSHRGNEPDSGRNVAVIGQQFKLVQPLSFSAPAPDGAQWEYYDLLADPGESVELSNEENADERAALQRDYEVWLRDVSDTRGYAPQRIWLGSEHENPTVLTRQDWRILTGPDGWGKGSHGVWALDCRRDGVYTAVLDIDEADAPGRLDFKFGATDRSQEYETGATRIVLEGLHFRQGLGYLDARLISRAQVHGPRMVTLTRTGDGTPR